MQSLEDLDVSALNRSKTGCPRAQKVRVCRSSPNHPATSQVAGTEGLFYCTPGWTHTPDTWRSIDASSKHAHAQHKLVARLAGSFQPCRQQQVRLRHPAEPRFFCSPASALHVWRGVQTHQHHDVEPVWVRMRSLDCQHMCAIIWLLRQRENLNFMMRFYEHTSGQYPLTHTRIRTRHNVLPPRFYTRTSMW